MNSRSSYIRLGTRRGKASTEHGEIFSSMKISIMNITFHNGYAGQHGERTK
jgi:hypothetical protein